MHTTIQEILNTEMTINYLQQQQQIHQWKQGASHFYRFKQYFSDYFCILNDNVVMKRVKGFIDALSCLQVLSHMIAQFKRLYHYGHKPVR